MVEDFIDSVLIIDDKKEEIDGLKSYFEEKDVWVTYFNPPKDKQEIDSISKPFKNRKLLFLDLRIDETKETIDNISVIIRPLLRKVISLNYGGYGIVMWTKHERHIIEFKKRIQKDKDKYELPLFVCGLDKHKYLKNGYDNLLTDLKEEFKKNFAANFFITWSILVNQGRDNAIKEIFNLVPNYQKQNINLEFLFFKLAQNYTGIHIDEINENYPLIRDAFKTFNDLLVAFINQSPCKSDIKIKYEDNYFITTSNEHAYYSRNQLTTNKKKLLIKKIQLEDENWILGKELTNNEKTEDLLNYIDKEITKLYSNINRKSLIDQTDIKQDVIVPGNVYEIKANNSPFIHPEVSENAIPIIIELTPPCDFSNKNRLKPRVASGYIKKYDRNNLPTKEKYYKEFWPIAINDEEPKTIIFDFSILGFVEEDDLKDETKYKILFRTKDKLFADILQKMSSHIARLGLSIIR